MTFCQTLIIAVIPSIAAIASAGLAAGLGFRDLRMRRRIETSKQFLSLFATAHGRPSDGRTEVGIAEQVACIHLIADFAAKEELVRRAAYEGLHELSTWGHGDDAMRKSSKSPSAPPQTTEMTPTSGQGNKYEEGVAKAAKQALQRLPKPSDP